MKSSAVQPKAHSTQEAPLSRQEGGNLCSRTCSWLTKSCTVSNVLKVAVVSGLLFYGINKLWTEQQAAIETPSCGLPRGEGQIMMRPICYPTSSGKITCTEPIAVFVPTPQ